MIYGMFYAVPQHSDLTKISISDPKSRTQLQKIKKNHQSTIIVIEYNKYNVNKVGKSIMSSLT